MRLLNLLCTTQPLLCQLSSESRWSALVSPTDLPVLTVNSPRLNCWPPPLLVDSGADANLMDYNVAERFLTYAVESSCLWSHQSIQCELYKQWTWATPTQGRQLRLKGDRFTIITRNSPQPTHRLLGERPNKRDCNHVSSVRPPVLAHNPVLGPPLESVPDPTHMPALFLTSPDCPADILIFQSRKKVLFY